MTRRGSGPDEESLLASRSEAERFSELFDRHADEIHRYLVVRAGWDAADELTAETFVRAFDGRHSYDPARGSVRPWLYGIATNVLHLHIRSKHRRSHAYERAGLCAVFVSEGPEGRVADRELLRKVLAQLDHRDQDIVWLIAGAALTYEEVARELLIPIGTVRSRYARARQRARDLLEREMSCPPSGRLWKEN